MNVKVTITYHVPVSRFRWGTAPTQEMCDDIKESLLDTSSKGWQARRSFSDYCIPTEVKVEPMEKIEDTPWPNSWTFPE